MLEWFNDLSNKAKKAVISAIVGLIFTGGGGGSYLVFAKASHFNEHIAGHRKVDIKKRIHVLEEQMLEYREMFGKQLENATETQKKRYREWKIEVEFLWKEVGA